MAVASARFAAQPGSRRSAVIARCSGPVPRSLRGANGVPELVEATRDAGRAALEDSSPALAGEAWFATKPRAQTTTAVAVLAAPASSVALAASPTLNAAVLPALVTAAAVSAALLLWRRSSETRLSSWERDVGIVYDDDEPTSAFGAPKRRVIAEWDSLAAPPGWGEDGEADDVAAPAPLRDRAAAVRAADKADASVAAPRRNNAGLGDDAPPTPSDARLLKAEAIDAELRAWEEFDRRAAAVKARRAVPVTGAGSAKDARTRAVRAAAEAESAAEAAVFRRKLEVAVAGEVAAARAAAAKAAPPAPAPAPPAPPAPAAPQPAPPRSRAAASPLPLRSDGVDGAPAEQVARLEEMKRIAQQAAAVAAAAAAGTASAGADDAAAAQVREKMEERWRQRAAAALDAARADTASSAPPTPTPTQPRVGEAPRSSESARPPSRGKDGKSAKPSGGTSAADRFRERVKDQRRDGGQ